MPIPVSAVPAIKASVFAALSTALDSQDNTTVVYDAEGTYDPLDVVGVGKAARILSGLAVTGGGGAGWLLEEIHLTITVDCWRGGDSPQLVCERAYELLGVVETTVRGDLTLGGLAVEARPVHSTDDSGWDEEESGRWCHIDLDVEITAQL